jgi:hypothetical protein
MNLISPHLKNSYSGSISGCQSGIVKCLIYFDIFDYPLTKSEILERMGGTNLIALQVIRDLENLVATGLIGHNEGFYFLEGRSSIAQHRLKLNDKAQNFWPKARKMSRLIAGFPFVEGIFITGSLAKNCMDENGDIDYLIITKPGRLWVCRALLTAYKKIFLFNQRRYFCVNYYLSSDALAIPDENVFTATEIFSAVPTYNSSQCQRFFESNSWTNRFYPNQPAPDYAKTYERNTTGAKGLMEFFLGGWLGEQFDEFSFRLFVWRWKKKFAHLSPESFEINFRSRRYVSKHHPQGFQAKVLTRYENKIREFENKQAVNL